MNKKEFAYNVLRLPEFKNGKRTNYHKSVFRNENNEYLYITWLSQIYEYNEEYCIVRFFSENDYNRWARWDRNFKVLYITNIKTMASDNDECYTLICHKDYLKRCIYYHDYCRIDNLKEFKESWHYKDLGHKII